MTTSDITNSLASINLTHEPAPEFATAPHQQRVGDQRPNA